MPVKISGIDVDERFSANFCLIKLLILLNGNLAQRNPVTGQNTMFIYLVCVWYPANFCLNSAMKLDPARNHFMFQQTKKQIWDLTKMHTARKRVTICR